MPKLYIILFLLLSSCSTPSPKTVYTPIAPPETPYDRSEYKHWIDEDFDCQNTRQEVLIAESLIPVTFKTKRRCLVKTGKWADPYTGETITDPKKLDIDHLVPLSEAHKSGGWIWDKETKKVYANDLSNPNHLIAVSGRANRAKGDKDPSRWMPKNINYHCDYLKNWQEVKSIWNLIADAKEIEFVTAKRSQLNCDLKK